MDPNASTQPVEISPEIKTFLQGLIQDSGIEYDDLDDPTKTNLMNELYERLDGFIAAEMVKRLPPQKVEEYIQMNEQKKTPQELEAFLRTEIPDVEKVFADIFLEFRDVYLGR